MRGLRGVDDSFNPSSRWTIGSIYEPFLYQARCIVVVHVLTFTRIPRRLQHKYTVA